MRILFLTIIPLIMLNAADVYVKIGVTKTKNGLSYAYSKLNNMGMNFFYKTKTFNDKNVYTVYSGPYNTNKEQVIALKNSRYFFKGAKLVRLSKIDNKTPENINQKEKISTKNRTKYSLSLALGYASAPSTHTIIDGSVDISEPKSDAFSLLLNGVYDISETFIVSANYMRFDSSDLVFDNIYASLGYKFKKFGNFSPHFGLLLGLSALKWDTSPLEQASPNSNNDSETYIYGSEIGLTYNGYEHFSPFIHYHCMFMGHVTNLKQDTTNTSKLEHKTLHTILFGVAYNF